MCELVSVQHAARVYGVHADTVRRWIRDGALHAVALPHKGTHKIYRIRLDRLERTIKDENQKQLAS